LTREDIITELELLAILLRRGPKEDEYPSSVELLELAEAVERRLRRWREGPDPL
jgi:hypothetical protein